MTHRERIRTALNHKEPDCVPIDIGGVSQTSICEKEYLDLMGYLGYKIEERDSLPTRSNQVPIAEMVQQLAVLDERLLEHFDASCRPIDPNPASGYRVEEKLEGDYYTFVDEWGTKLYKPKDGGLYYDYHDFPMKESTWEAFKNMEWPDPKDPGRMKGAKEKAKKLYETTDYALMGSALFGGGIFEQCCRYHPMEDFLALTCLDPGLADAMMDQVKELYMEATSIFLDEVGEYLEVVTYWDDITTQNGSLISPEFYRKHVKPKEKELFDLIHAKTGAKLYMHNCGAAYDFIGDFIEIGVDIVNPVQTSAAGMGDTKKLKREFGKDVVFWGGTVDPQSTLQFGTPQEVKEEAKRRMEDLMPGGGFVFSSIHNIQASVPVENVAALFEAAAEYGTY